MSADPSVRSQRERYTTRNFFDYQEAPTKVILPLLAKQLGTTKTEVQRRLHAAGVKLGLGDLNGDGRVATRIAGNVIRTVQPSVVLLAGSNQAKIEGDRLQDIVMLNRYNQFGQMISMMDAEGNVDTWAYFPETDPDGDGKRSGRSADIRQLSKRTGGYLKQEVKDTTANLIRNNKTNPPPTNIRVSYSYDDVGNQTSMTDGRGIRTDFFVNELNQVVQTIRAATVPQSGPDNPQEPLELVAFRYLGNTFYDFNNNATGQQIEDRGDTSNTGGFVDYNFKFNILDNLIEKTEEVDVTEILVTRYRYDANENRVLTIYPEGNATTSDHDERDILIRKIRGACGLSGPL